MMIGRVIRTSRYGGMSFGDWLIAHILMLPGIIIGMSFHEFGHAFASTRLGDPLPKQQGRVTLNPMKHIDPYGLIFLIFGGFGWGVPVQIDNRFYKHPRRDELIVSFAGVIMNFLIALGSAFLLKGIFAVDGFNAVYGTGFLNIIFQIVLYMMQINLVLMIFNLLPVPPLDGFGIITQIFDLRKYRWYNTFYRYGYMILMFLILFGITGFVITPAVTAISRGLLHLVGILA